MRPVPDVISRTSGLSERYVLQRPCIPLPDGTCLIAEDFIAFRGLHTASTSQQPREVSGKSLGEVLDPSVSVSTGDEKRMRG